MNFHTRSASTSTSVVKKGRCSFRIPGSSKTVSSGHLSMMKSDSGKVYLNIPIDHMGRNTIKGQWPHLYRPSATRRASGLSPIRESSETAHKRWRRAIQRIKIGLQISRNLNTKGSVTRGRFTARNTSPPKRVSPPKSRVSLNPYSEPGVYFVTWPYKRGRFKVEDTYGFVPMPKRRTNAKSL
jgi:hypothetical protein